MIRKEGDFHNSALDSSQGCRTLEEYTDVHRLDYAGFSDGWLTGFKRRNSFRWHTLQG
jgi:hypothetical protein